MGWLRDLMAHAELRSFGDLARRALAHPEWPSDSRAQPRSLEAIFGRLDRKIDLDWLADRPGVQQVLATLLNSQVAEIRSVLVGQTPTKGPISRLRLDALPMARALDLEHEALPPTIPEQIGLPATWNHLLWIAPSGAGATLTMRYLVARGLAQAIAVDSLDSFRSLPIQGPPLFLKIPQELAEAVLADFTLQRSVCLAITTNGPVNPALLGKQPFRVVESQSTDEQLERIVDWALLRSPQGSMSKRGALLEWLRHGPGRWGLLVTMGDVLGFVGVYLGEEAGCSPPLTKEALLRNWLKARTEVLAKHRFSDVLSLGQLLPDALLDLAQSTCLDDMRPWLCPRSLEDWLTMVPAQHRRGPDLDWLMTQVGAQSTTIRPRELERVAKRLPPGAHRIIVALRELGILRPATSNDFSIRPHFFARLLQALATERIVSSLPVFWGEGLLKPHFRPTLLGSLQQRVHAEPEALAEDLLEVVDAESAPLVCAIETAYVLLGLELLTGAELNEHTAASLLEEQDALVLIGHSPPLRRTAPHDSPLLEDSEGAFYLASFALAEACKGHHGPISSLLDPWSQSVPQPGWGQVLDELASTLERALEERPRWLDGALTLLERVRHVLGTATDVHSTANHRLFEAPLLLDALELGVAETLDRDCLPSDFQLRLFFEHARLRQRSSTTILHALGELLVRLDTTLLARWLELVPPDFWRTIAPDPCANLIGRVGLDERVVPWHELTLETWVAWLHQRDSLGLNESLLPWKYVPSDIGVGAISSSMELATPIRALAWDRWTDVVMAEIERHRTRHPSIAEQWIAASPPSSLQALAETAMRLNWHHADERITSAVSLRLHEGIARRLPGWPKAYECLHRIERERHRY